MSFEENIKRLEDVLVVVTAIQERQSQIQKIQAQELARHDEWLQAHDRMLQAHDRMIQQIDERILALGSGFAEFLRNKTE